MRGRKACAGFTLVELAIVLVIVSLMTGFGMKAMQSTTSDNCYAKTRVQMRSISLAMQKYVRSHSKYPIPSRVDVGVTNPTFGKSDDGSNIDTDAATDTVYIGALPFSTLRLAPSFAADCWGHKFTYMVTKTLTIGNTNAGAITVNTGDLASAFPLTSHAAFAVISHGAATLSACARNFSGSKAQCACNTKQADPSVTRVDKENCDTNNATIFSTTFNNGPAAPDFFDDLVVYQDKLQTLASNCLPADFVWSTHCGAPVSQLVSGTTTTLTNSNAGYSGAATVKCTNGILSLQSSPAATCTSSACPAGTAYSWSPCSGTLASALGDGGTATITNSASGHSGSAPVICNTDTLASNGTPSCYTNCASGSNSWGTGSHCTGNYAALNGVSPGNTATVTNTAANYTGTETVTCTDGTISYSGQSCTANGCAAGSESWSSHCSGSYGALAAGGTASVTNTAAHYSGSETVTCASDGSGTVTPSGASCTAAPCTASSATWLTNCTGSYGSILAGSSTTVNNTAAGYAGTETLTCAADGTGVVTPSAQSCTAGCAAVTGVSWNTNCSGDVPSLGSGDSTVVNNSASGYTGSETATCTGGTLSYSGQSCTATTCSSPCGTINNGSTCTAYQYVAPTGPCTSEVRSCTNGVLSGSYPHASCTAGCSATTDAWTGASSGCSGSVAALASGDSETVTNTASAHQGTETASCTSGTLSYSSLVCNAAVNGSCGTYDTADVAAAPSTTAQKCAAGTASAISGSGPWTWTCAGAYGGTTDSCKAYKTCAATTDAWAGASSGCSGSVAAKGHGGTETVTNTASAHQGTETATCNATGTGVWAYSSAVCNASVNGSCGSYNGADVSAAPSTTAQKCAAGSSSSISGSGPWTWTCAGTYGGSTASCKAYKTCAATTDAWTGTASGCSGSVAAKGHGGSETVTNTASGHTGTETATCNASGTGAWAYSSTVCAVSGCGAVHIEWTSTGGNVGGTGIGSTECADTTTAAANNATFAASSGTATDVAIGYGSATFKCVSGGWTFVSGTCRLPCRTC